MSEVDLKSKVGYFLPKSPQVVLGTSRRLEVDFGSLLYQVGSDWQTKVIPRSIVCLFFSICLYISSSLYLSVCVSVSRFLCLLLCLSLCVSACLSLFSLLRSSTCPFETLSRNTSIVFPRLAIRQSLINYFPSSSSVLSTPSFLPSVHRFIQPRLFSSSIQSPLRPPPILFSSSRYFIHHFHRTSPSTWGRT